MKLLWSCLVAFLAGSVIPGVRAGFSTDCIVNAALDGTFIDASCEDESGHWVDTELDLDLCFWNHDGVLKAGNNGDYSKSCSGCSLEDGDGTKYLYCTSCIYAGTGYATTIDISDAVWNNDGLLDCYGHLGVDG